MISADLPDKTGVYVLKDPSGKVLYVGKARSIRDRVSSHISSPRDRELMKLVAKTDYILTETEHEALLLESNLIKRYRPRYNVRLKDDKRYPYIELTDEKFPSLRITRSPKMGHRYYGPFTRVVAARRTLKWVRAIFPLRSCKRLPTRPCLDYEIHLCSAPCVGKITEERYRKLVSGADAFLSGKRHSPGRELICELRIQMKEAAQDLEYERAARIRDEIASIERTLERQTIETSRKKDMDLIAIASGDGLACIEIFFLRDGKLVGADHFYMEGDPNEALATFIKQYYVSTAPPREILVHEDLPEEVRGWLGELGVKVKMSGGKELMKMAQENASSLLRQEELKEKNGIRELGEWLHIPRPSLIDGIDISNFGGKEAVGSVVVFRDGEPSRREYRHFRIKEDEPDDVGMMAEVVRRRYSDAEEMPGLILLDGGRGQLNGAKSVLRELGIDPPILAIAKKEEEIYLPDEGPRRLRPDSQALHLLQHVRDEAHRFAISYHKKIRSKKERSWLDDVPGIGEGRKISLLKHFNSPNGVKKASEKELQVVLNHRGAVKSLLEYIRTME